ncbi:MAG: potassium channel protein [Bacteroidales bacterium]|nr:potassium channel protein [Bacteroidales bacterium]
MKKTTFRKVQKRYPLLLILFVFIFGVTGYEIIEDLSFFDSLYMTVITLSTVGFREVKQLSEGGKIFTIILIITSLGVFAYAVSTLTGSFIEGQLNKLLKGYIKKSDMKKMKDHVIICGYGSNGMQAANELLAHQTICVIIDADKEKMESLQENENLIFMVGDATDDEVLIKVWIEKASALITTLPLDTDNVFVVLTARALNGSLLIISRASSESSQMKLRRAGVDNVVMPEKVGGAYMAKLVTRPDVVEFLGHLSVQGADPTNLDEIFCDNMPEEFYDQKIDKIEIRKKFGINIIGIKTSDGQFMLNPPPHTVVQPNTKLFVLGTPEQIKKLRGLMRDTNH